MLAAVINHQNAASKLYEMLSKQEAFFGGYYSGIGVLNEKSFHLHKEVGPVEVLGDLSSIAGFAGNAGLAHSRTKSGGGAGRAQPFIDHTKTVLGMGTGVKGIFSDVEDARQSYASELEEDGVIFSSAEKVLAGSATLKDGSTVHNTELVTQAVGHLVNQGTTPEDAVRKVTTEIPAEGAYIFLFRDWPESLFISNYNMRFLAVRMKESVVVASSHLGLNDEEQAAAVEIVPNSITICESSGLTSSPLSEELESYLDRTVPDGIERAFLDCVRDNPGKTWGFIVEKGVLPLFSTSKATLVVEESFRVAEHLLSSGRLRVEKKLVAGSTSKYQTPESVFHLPL